MMRLSRTVWGCLWVMVVGLAVNARAAEPGKDEINRYLQTHFATVSTSPISTGILYDLVLPLSKMSYYDGTDSAKTISRAAWLQAAWELRRASLEESTLPEPDIFRDMARASSPQQLHPILFLNYVYNQIKPNLSPDSVFEFRNGELGAIHPDAFVQNRIFAGISINAATYRGADTRFQLDLKGGYYSNDAEILRSMDVDFDDGMGYRPVPSQGDVIVHYQSTGRKLLRFRAHFEDGSVLAGKSEFDVLALTTPNPTETWAVQATIPYLGQYAAGQAYVYLAPGHIALTNPVVISEGFDLDNSMFWDELYALLDQQNMVENMRTMGYDAVVLNYTDATTYIEANAYLVEALIDRVNQTLGNGRSTALIGPSMGGLTTRFALAHMEASGREHHVRTWISFDSPQRGANIPLGLQYWIDFFASQSTEAAALRDALNSPAAREMLIAHFTSPPSSTAGRDPLRTDFQNHLVQAGNYPQAVRRVAIANGSGLLQGCDFNPGAQLVSYEYRSFLVDISGNIWALNNQQPQTVFYGMINRIWPLSDDYRTVTVQPTWPWDNAPGGQRASMLQLDTTAVPYGDVVALHANHCFIPTISALDLDISDPFYNVSGDSSLMQRTSFNALYYPVQNQEHVAITPENYNWFIGETVDSLGAPTVVIQADSAGARLFWNPIPGAQTYRVYATSSLNSWPNQYSVVTDTSWLDPDTASMRTYYRVTSNR